jgi:hypothetical protein
MKSAQNVATFYRVSIDLQKFATPDDIKALFERRTTFEPGFAKLVSDLSDLVFLQNKDCHRFDHRPLSNSVSLYVGSPDNKRILIGFCGKAQLLTLPIPVVLQYFPPGSYDVAFVRDPVRLGFTTGSSGYAESFTDMIERLRRDLNLDRYEKIFCMGTSGGGAAALAGGTLLDAASAASFCGRPPTTSSIYGQAKSTVDMEAVIRKSRLPKERAFALYGTENRQDKEHARQLAKLMDLTVLPMPGISDHNLAAGLHIDGRLGQVFQAIGFL